MLRHARLLGRCHYLLERHGLTEHVPQRLRDQLRGALAQTRYLQTQALRELRHVVRRLRHQAIDVVALKGVAYLAAQLPPAAWRSLSDIDLLVRQSDVDAAERILQQAGWRIPEHASVISRALNSVCAARARAAARAHDPPEPTAMTPSSGSIRSPVPDRAKRLSRSATTSCASRRRSARSVRQSRATSTADDPSLPSAIRMRCRQVRNGNAKLLDTDMNSPSSDRTDA